jgi:hypothetical protein
MYPKFPGLESYLIEKRVTDIENSITSSLLDNSESKKCVFKPFYIIGFILIGCFATVITYMCITLL